MHEYDFNNSEDENSVKMTKNDINEIKNTTYELKKRMYAKEISKINDLFLKHT